MADRVNFFFCGLIMDAEAPRNEGGEHPTAGLCGASCTLARHARDIGAQHGRTELVLAQFADDTCELAL